MNGLNYWFKGEVKKPNSIFDATIHSSSDSSFESVQIIPFEYLTVTSKNDIHFTTLLHFAVYEEKFVFAVRLQKVYRAT